MRRMVARSSPQNNKKTEIINWYRNLGEEDGCNVAERYMRLIYS